MGKKGIPSSLFEKAEVRQDKRESLVANERRKEGREDVWMLPSNSSGKGGSFV